MSATGRGGERKAEDQYYTDPELARVLVARLMVDGFVDRESARVLEPSCGMGAFAVAAARQLQPSRLVVNDISDAATIATAEAIGSVGPQVQRTTCDFVELDDWKAPEERARWDAIVGNPPYGEAESHVRHALSFRARGGCVAFLLRLAFLESEERYEFWREHPASRIYVLVPRPSFTGGATDNCAYGWFVWQRGGPKRPTEIDVLKWREPKKRAKRERTAEVR